MKFERNSSSFESQLLQLNDSYLYMWASPTWSRNVFAKSKVSSQCPHMYSNPVGSVASSSWFNICSSNTLGDKNVILHSLHSNSLGTWLLSLFVLYLVWILWWRFKLPDTANALPHKSHLKGFSPVWSLWCVFLFRWMWWPFCSVGTFGGEKNQTLFPGWNILVSGPFHPGNVNLLSNFYKDCSLQLVTSFWLQFSPMPTLVLFIISMVSRGFLLTKKIMINQQILIQVMLENRYWETIL